MSKNEQLATVYKLLKETTSIGVVSDFLKSKNLSHSAGSWDDLFSKRLQPRIDENALSSAELVELLRSVEEFGRQHTLLYACEPEVAIKIMGRSRIGRALGAMGLSGITTSPVVFDQPIEPTIADVRWKSAGVDLEFTVKEIETRTTQEYDGENRDGTKITKTYNLIKERVVNVATLKRNGELEVRVSSRTGMTGYDKDVRQFMSRIHTLIPLDQFREVSLIKAKSQIYAKRAQLANRIRFSDISFRNDDDITMRASTGAIAGNLVSSPSTVSILEIAAKAGTCQSHNLWFVKSSPHPTRDIRVLLSGEVNEFSINANCSEADYEYVLSELRSFNA